MKKALIPAAGLGTRMFPATKAVKKELLPIVTPDGICKPILQAIVEEAVEAGADDVAIIVRPEDQPLLEAFFAAPEAAYAQRLPAFAREQCDALTVLGSHVSFIQQREQLGFGHAVYCAKDWAGDEPVLLLLGDHIYCSNTEKSCAKQLIDAFESHEPHAIVSLYQAPGEAVHHYGTVAGRWLDDKQDVLDLTEFAEKPSLDYAQQHLAIPGLPDNTFLCVYGQYVLTPDVFQILGQQIQDGVKVKNEFQLTTALEELRRQKGMYGFMVQGEHYDTGQPREYLASLIAYAQHTLD